MGGWGCRALQGAFGGGDPAWGEVGACVRPRRAFLLTAPRWGLCGEVGVRGFGFVSFYSFPSSKKDQKVAASSRGCSGLECCQALRHQPEPLLLLLLRSLLLSIPPLGFVFVLLVVRQNPSAPPPKSLCPAPQAGVLAEPPPHTALRTMRGAGCCCPAAFLLFCRSPSFVMCFFYPPFTCFYLVLAFPSPSPSEYFASAPVSRERPSACLPSRLVTCFINRQYFPSSFVVRILCSAALSCLPASQRNR